MRDREKSDIMLSQQESVTVCLCSPANQEVCRQVFTFAARQMNGGDQPLERIETGLQFELEAIGCKIAKEDVIARLERVASVMILDQRPHGGS